MRQKKVNRWLILAAGFIFNLCLSGNSAFSVFVNPLVQEKGWDASSISLAYTIYLIMVCLWGIIIGAVQNRIKTRVMVYVGSLLFSIGWFLTGNATSIESMYLIFGIIAGTGGGSLYNFIVTNTIKWFPDRKGMISGILLGGAALGPVMVSPIATWSMSRFSVSTSFHLIGALFFVLTLAFGWLIQTPGSIHQQDEYDAREKLTVDHLQNKDDGCDANRDKNWKEMMQTGKFWMLYVIFVLACVPVLMMYGSVASIAQNQVGMTSSLASVSVSVLAIANFGGRMVLGTISDYLGRIRTLQIALVLNILGILLMKNALGTGIFFASVCIMGACGGAILVMFPPICSDLFGLKNSSLNYSILFSAFSISGFIGPQLSAHYYTIQGSYQMAFIWAAICSGVGILFSFLFQKMGHQQ